MNTRSLIAVWVAISAALALTCGCQQSPQQPQLAALDEPPCDMLLGPRAGATPEAPTTQEATESPSPQDKPAFIFTTESCTLSRCIAADLDVEYRFRGPQMSRLDPTWSEDAEFRDRCLVRGTHSGTGWPRVGWKTAVRGVYEPPGMMCVTLDLSRGGIREVLKLCAPSAGQIELFDSEGECYAPVGFLHLYGRGGHHKVRVDTDDGLPSLANLPLKKLEEREMLHVYFLVPMETLITELRLADVVLGECRLMVWNGRKQLGPVGSDPNP